MPKNPKNLSPQLVEEISWLKGEPAWMREFRLKSLRYFENRPLPQWGGDLSGIDFEKIRYYLRPAQKKAKNWDELPKEIRQTYEKLGIPEAEKRFLAGVSSQFDSEVIYGSLKKVLATKGVVFLDMESGLREYPDLVKRYFGTIVPPNDNKFAALNSAVWSGGSFVYVPPGVEVDLPLQAYFWINAAQMGQFERTLIIADEGSAVHYLEGCSAPVYTSNSLHAAVVEVVVKKGAKVRYTTIQNWSKNVYNLVTKRMWLEEKAVGEWLDGNLGSKLTMKYPAMIFAGEGSRGEMLSIALAGQGQHQDAGAKVIHLKPNTSSRVVSRSITKEGGRTSYRGLLQVNLGAKNVKSKVTCEALILDEKSRADTYPTLKIAEPEVQIEHEASVAKIGEEQLFYLMSRGVPQAEAETMIVNGFIEPMVKELPLEYAVELNRLVELEIKGSIG
jgi:Fe-S cluster assembly protein SufB